MQSDHRNRMHGGTNLPGARGHLKLLRNRRNLAVRLHIVDYTMALYLLYSAWSMTMEMDGNAQLLHTCTAHSQAVNCLYVDKSMAVGLFLYFDMWSGGPFVNMSTCVKLAVRIHGACTIPIIFHLDQSDQLDLILCKQLVNTAVVICIVHSIV